MKLLLVPPRTGVQWFKLGLQTFFKQPLALTGLMFMYLAVISVCSIIPVLGNLIALALVPAATLGMMAAAQVARNGGFPMPAILACALRSGHERRQSMMVLGVLYVAGFLLSMGLSSLMDGGQFAKLILLGGELTPEMVQDSGFLGAAWVSTLATLPLSMLFWHAPALVHWHNISPVKSLFFSLVACWRNKGAFTLFGLMWTGLLLGIILLLSVLVVALGSGFTSLLMQVLMVLILSSFFASLLFTFQDCFGSDADELTGEPKK